MFSFILRHFFSILGTAVVLDDYDGPRVSLPKNWTSYNPDATKLALQYKDDPNRDLVWGVPVLAF